MINVNLTPEERDIIINETNDLIFECSELQMEILGLKDHMSRFTLLKRLFSKEDERLYRLMEKTIIIKTRRLLCLQNKIEINKEKLGININNNSKKKK